MWSHHPIKTSPVLCLEAAVNVEPPPRTQSCARCECGATTGTDAVLCPVLIRCECGAAVDNFQPGTFTHHNYLKSAACKLTHSFLLLSSLFRRFNKTVDFSAFSSSLTNFMVFLKFYKFIFFIPFFT